MGADALALSESQRRVVWVVGWMACALVCFSGMAISIRELARHLGIFEILALRCLGGLALLGAFAACRGGGIGPLRPVPLHLARNLVHVIAQTAWAYGITVLPLATVFALEFTAPAWVTLLAVLFLGERATRARLGGLVLGFAGVLVVLRPGAEAFRPEALIVLAAAFCFATALVLTKAMTARMNVLTLLFWMQVLQLPLLLLAHAVGGDGGLPFRTLGSAPPLMLAMLCLSGLIAQVAVASAFRHGDAATVVPLDFLRIPLIAAVGAAMYGEPFDPVVLMGAAITAAGILWNLREAAGAADPRARRARPSAPAAHVAQVRPVAEPVTETEKHAAQHGGRSGCQGPCTATARRRDHDEGS
jgi:drug/metabolite transporter (DMT)-like permease